MFYIHCDINKVPTFFQMLANFQRNYNRSIYLLLILGMTKTAYTVYMS